MKKRHVTVAAVLAAIIVAAIASAQSIGIGIKKDATLAGTGSSGDALRVNTTTLAGSGMTGGGTALNVIGGTGITVAADSVSVNTSAIQSRVTGTCSSPNGVISVGSDGTVACATGAGGITNSAGANVIPKSDGTNLVASGATDDGTTFAVDRSIRVARGAGVAAALEFVQAGQATWSIWQNSSTDPLLFHNTVAGDSVCSLSTAGTLNCTGLQVGGAGVSMLTNSAGANVLTKSDGTNLVASGATDDGTTFSVNRNTTRGSTVANSHLTWGQDVFLDTVGTGFGAPNLFVRDTTSMAQGVGGAVSFQGAYQSTTVVDGAEIKMMKTNGTSDNQSFDLVFGTRLNGESIGEAMRIGADKSLTAIGNVTLGDAITDAHTINGVASLTTGNANGINVTNTTTGQTGNYHGADIAMGGSYDTTAGSLFPMAIEAIVSATESAGGNLLTNTALYGDASGGDVNYGLWVGQGKARFDDQAYMGDTSFSSIASNVDVLTIGNTGTSQTTSNSLISATHSGTFALPTQNEDARAVSAVVSASKASGEFTLINTALYGSATNGDINYGLWVDNGDAQIDNDATVGGKLLVLGSGADGLYVNNVSSDLLSDLYVTTANQLGTRTIFLDSEVSVGGTTNGDFPLTVTGDTTLGNSATDQTTFTNGPAGINTYDGVYGEYVQEWLHRVTATSNVALDWLSCASTGAGALCSTTDNAGESGRPGVQLAVTGTAATGRAAWTTSLAAFSFSDGDYSFRHVSKWPTLSTGSEEYATIIGFMDAVATVAQTDGCGFIYDRGNVTGGNGSNLDKLLAYCCAGATCTYDILDGSNACDESFTSVDTPVVADTWLDLEVRMTGATRAEFYSDGVKVCNINTNVPATTQLTGAGFNHFKSAGTGSRGYRFDHTSIAWTLSAARSP